MYVYHNIWFITGFWFINTGCKAEFVLLTFSISKIVAMLIWPKRRQGILLPSQNSGDITFKRYLLMSITTFRGNFNKSCCFNNHYFDNFATQIL